MNFVGHARIASWIRTDAAFVLGAMLPDFARMAGTRLREVRDPDLAAGVHNHHAVDDVFHGQRAFVDLQVATRRALTTAGVPRPPALAVAHVGVELLLDGAILHEEDLPGVYIDAISRARLALDGASFRGQDGQERYAGLCDRLEERGVPHVYRDPQIVAEILERILSRSEILRLERRHRPAVAQVLARIQPAVHEAAPGLLQAVSDGLKNVSPEP